MVDADTGSSKLDDIRTSYGTFLRYTPVGAEVMRSILSEIWVLGPGKARTQSSGPSRSDLHFGQSCLLTMEKIFRFANDDPA